MLQIASLNSGSNGNCYYIGNSTEAVLIDAGISCRETEKRMQQIGLSMKLVKAIIISHEHTDHTKGVTTLANKFTLPVFITEQTAKNGPRLIKHLSKPFVTNEIFKIGSLEITPFGKQHDAADPHSFLITYNDCNVGVFTDIGVPCNNLIHYFKQCHAAFLEANYDEEMLENGSYPLHLKNRIRGGVGHLSNTQALELFKEHRQQNLSHLILSHLSKENNSPQLAASLFEKHAGKTNIVVASRYAATEVIHVLPNHQESTTKKPYLKSTQLGLFS